jgi:hypothetical protein
MPMLITALLGGMAAFYFYGKPRSDEEASLVAKNTKELTTVEETLESTPETEPAPHPSDGPTFPTSPAEAAKATPEINPPTAGMGDFTPWMSPAELDSYIKKQNEGHSTSFWRRGHWITAVEGRWNGEDHEFRIAYDRTPQSPEWQWQYRVNQTPEEFLENTKDLRARGFRIVQVQSFDHPDSRRRYQTVWERTRDLETAAVKPVEPAEPESTVAANHPVVRGIAPPAPVTPEPPAPRMPRWIPAPLAEQPAVAEVSGESTQEAPAASTRSLDVNNLRFR